MNEEKRDDDTLNGSDDAYSYDLFDVAAQNEHSAEQIIRAEEAEPEISDDERENGENQAAEKTISADLIRGHINTIILRALYDGDKYGYEIIADIEQKSHGQYSLKQPSLYSALKRLEREGYVTSYWGGSAGGGRRKYFSLTDNGKEIAERNQSEWEYSRTVIDSLISDRAFDFENNAAPLAVDMRVLRDSTTRVPRYDGEGAEEYDDDFEPDEIEEVSDTTNDDVLNEEFEQQRAAFEAERSRVEEELRLREEELRTREELFRAEEEQRNRALTEQAEQQRLEEEKRFEEERQRVEAERAAAEVEARRQEEERLRQIQEARIAEEQALKAAEEERNRIREEIAERTRQEEERANAAALRAEKEQQNARIVEMEPFTEERERYEQMLKQQEAEFKALHEKELAEQERRIREEDERLFRQREQQMIHQNYLNLVNTPVQEEPEETVFYNPTVEPKTSESSVNPESERGYRSVIQKLYSNTIKQEEQHALPEETVKKPVSQTPAPAPVAAAQEVKPIPAPIPVPAPIPAPAPAPKKNVAAPARPVEPPKEKTAPKPLSGIDFYDLEMRAAQDGIRITTSGGRTREVSETVSYNLVHKGKALFFSALVVFLLCIAEGSIALGFQNALNLPRFYPYFIWGTGLALLLVTGLAYVNHYGERALRTAGNLLINVIVTYALCIIIILIVSLAVQIDFTSVGQLTTYIIFPIVYFFGIVVFGLVYYMQVRPNKED